MSKIVRWKGYDKDGNVVSECIQRYADIKSAANDLFEALLEAEPLLKDYPLAHFMAKKALDKVLNKS